MSNINAIHFRWFDQLTQQVKETIALVSPAESVVNICAFVGLATQAPNFMFFPSAGAGPKPGVGTGVLGAGKPSLGFAPDKSAVDRFRSNAVFIPGSVPGDHASCGFSGKAS